MSTAILLNAGALTWHADLLGEREARKLSWVWGWRWRWWKGLLRGEVGWRRLRRLTRSTLKRTGRLLGRALRWPIGRGPASEGGEFDSDFDRLQGFGTRLVMAFSGDEPLFEELQADGVPERLSRWPDIELSSLPGCDHPLRSLAAQVATGDLLDRALAKELNPGAETGLEGPVPARGRGSRAMGRGRHGAA